MGETDVEQWESIAEAVKELEAARFELFKALTHEGNVSREVYGEHYSRMKEHMTELRADLGAQMHGTP